MALLEILKYPHPILRKRSEVVTKIDEDIIKLVQNMKETMYQEGGVGLAACQVGGFQACTTSAVLIESQRTLEDFPERSSDRFHELLANIPWKLLPVPPEAVIERYTQYIDPKDAHVLAAAVEGRSDFLLTLDRRHFAVLRPLDGGRFKIVP